MGQGQPGPRAHTGVYGRAIDALAADVDGIPAVRRVDLHAGDWLEVRTRNSVYWLCQLADGTYSVSGGWFDQHGSSPQRVGVNGCTFGGCAIKTDIVAAPGLFLEFDNQVTTTRIRQARVLRDDPRNLH